MIPSLYEEFEGDWSLVPGPFIYPNGSRSQSLLPSELFDSVPDTHRWLKEIRWRPDGNETDAGSNTHDMLIRLSTTQKTVNDLSMVFDNNHGLDETIVLDGESVESTENIGPPGGPKEFDGVIAFEQPFYYDPGQGNLLVDFTARGSATFNIIPDGGTSSEFVYIINSQNWNAATATRLGTNGGTVFQFVFVPEPTTCTLAAFALLGLISLSRRAPT